MVWLLSMPSCGEVHTAMQEVMNLSSTDASIVHKDRTKAKLKRDAKDLQSIMDYLNERKQFSKDSKELRSLSSELLAEKAVNVDSAESRGNTILTSMEGLSISKHKFVKKEQVATLASSVYVSVDGEKLLIHNGSTSVSLLPELEALNSKHCSSMNSAHNVRRYSTKKF